MLAEPMRPVPMNATRMRSFAPFTLPVKSDVVSAAAPACRNSRRLLSCAISPVLSGFPVATGICRTSPPDLDQLGFAHSAAVVRQFQRHGALALDLLAEDRTRVVRAERIDPAIWRGIMNDAPLHPLHVIVVGIHEVHAGQH